MMKTGHREEDVGQTDVDKGLEAGAAQDQLMDGLGHLSTAFWCFAVERREGWNGREQ